MIGQSLSHMFKPEVRRGESTERGVLDRLVTPTAISICFQLTRGSLLSPGASSVSIGQIVSSTRSVGKEVLAAAEVSMVLPTACMCQCQSLNPGV